MDRLREMCMGLKRTCVTRSVMGWQVSVAEKKRQLEVVEFKN